MIYIIFFLLSFSLKAEDRIVSLSPDITNTMIDLGLKNKIVCSASNSKNIKSVGTYNNPNIEKIIECSPTLIIATTAGTPPSLYEKLKKMNFNIYLYNPKKIEDIKSFITFLSKKFNSKKGNKFIKKFDKICINISKTAITIINFNPIMVVGGNSFISEAMNCGGFKNLFLESGYPKTNIEKIIKLNPDVIIVPSDYPVDSNEFNLLKKNFKSKIKRIKADNIMQASTNLLKGIKEIKKLHNNLD